MIKNHRCYSDANGGTQLSTCSHLEQES
jgi:hypothetical protein